MAALLLSSSPDAAAAVVETARDCEAEATAIVGQLEAEHDGPVSREGLAPAREAALRGCLTDARPEPERGAAPESDEPAGRGFWDRIPGSDAERSSGHERLRRRGRY